MYYILCPTFHKCIYVTFYVSIYFILPACELDSMRRSNVCNIADTTTWTCSISIRWSSLSGNILEIQNIFVVLNSSSVRGVMMKNIYIYIYISLSWIESAVFMQINSLYLNLICSHPICFITHGLNYCSVFCIYLVVLLHTVLSGSGNVMCVSVTKECV